MAKIRVLVVDDSKMMQDLISQILNQDPEIEVCGTAVDPYDARDKIKQLHPDVLTLDVEMPQMDGITFLKNLMRLNPVPTVMVSSLTEKGAEATFNALSIGATDFVTKPKINSPQNLEAYSDELIEKVKAAACAKHRKAFQASAKSANKLSKNLSRYQLVAIGASTGGIEAITEVIADYPIEAPPVVIAQHIPEGFSASFADRLNKRVAGLSVMEASDNSIIKPGHVYIAPGDKHLSIKRSGANLVCRLDMGERVNKHRPSVEVLFNSVSEEVSDKAVGIMLTGMGADGAAGMQRMKEKGAFTIAQDEQSSVVWGMPGSCVKIGAAMEVLSLNKIVPRLIKLFEKS